MDALVPNFPLVQSPLARSFASLFSTSWWHLNDMIEHPSSRRTGHPCRTAAMRFRPPRSVHTSAGRRRERLGAGALSTPSSRSVRQPRRSRGGLGPPLRGSGDMTSTTLRGIDTNQYCQPGTASEQAGCEARIYHASTLSKGESPRVEQAQVVPALNWTGTSLAAPTRMTPPGAADGFQTAPVPLR